MFNKKKRRWIAALLAVTVACSSYGYFHSGQAITANAQSQTASESNTQIPESFQFLKSCDTKAFIKTSVTSQQAREMLNVIENEIKGITDEKPPIP